MAIAIKIRTETNTRAEILPNTLVTFAWLKKLWWHTYSYLTIFFLMGLTVGSLVILYLYGFSQKFQRGKLNNK